MKKFLICILMISFMFTFVGCSNETTSTINKVSETVNKVENVVEKLDIIPSKSLIISEIMETKPNIKSSEQIVTYKPNNYSEDEGTGFDGSTFTSAPSQMNNYVGKLYSLREIAQNSIDINDSTEYLITCITTKADNIEKICSVITKKNREITSNEKSAIEDICSNLLLNANRLTITKDDVKTEASSVTSLKRNYTSNIEQLNGKYTRLINAMETRNSYLNNICYCLDNMYNLLCTNCYPNCEEKEETKKTWSNIDTYKNTNKVKKNDARNDNNNSNQNPYYNGRNEYNPYYGYMSPNGRGGTNPFYGYGMFGGMGRFGGMGGYGGYPYSPYTNYNPYVPNIDTFGTYTNVDTYRPMQPTINEVDENEDDKVEVDKKLNEIDDYRYDYYYHPYFYPYYIAPPYMPHRYYPLPYKYDNVTVDKNDENEKTDTKKEETENVSHITKGEDPKIEKLESLA